MFQQALSGYFKQPVEVMVEEQVKRQFLNVMFKQLKNLKEEEPHLFYQSLLLMDTGNHQILLQSMKK